MAISSYVLYPYRRRVFCRRRIFRLPPNLSGRRISRTLLFDLSCYRSGPDVARVVAGRTIRISSSHGGNSERHIYRKLSGTPRFRDHSSILCSRVGQFPSSLVATRICNAFQDLRSYEFFPLYARHNRRRAHCRSRRSCNIVKPAKLKRGLRLSLDHGNLSPFVGAVC